MTKTHAFLVPREIEQPDLDVYKDTLGTIYARVREVLDVLGMLDRLDYFDITSILKMTREHEKVHQLKLNDLLPNWRWVSCFAAPGGSEGVYIHVDLIGPGERDLSRQGRFVSQPLLLGKTFDSLAFGCEVAKVLTILLNE